MHKGAGLKIFKWFDIVSTRLGFLAFMKGFARYDKS